MSKDIHTNPIFQWKYLIFVISTTSSWYNLTSYILVIDEIKKTITTFYEIS